MTTDVTLSEHTYRFLMDRIKDSTYPLGSRLPSENDLASEIGVSRPIVRVALARLRDGGLVVSRQGSGSFVSGADSTGPTGYSSLKSIDDISAWYDFRKYVEGDSVALAASRATSSDVLALRELLKIMDETEDSGRYKESIDFKFHMKIAEISGNRFFSETLKMLRSHLSFVARFVRSLSSEDYAGGRQELRDEHKFIVDAIEKNDPKLARKLMADHIEGSQRRVFQGEKN